MRPFFRILITPAIAAAALSAVATPVYITQAPQNLPERNCGTGRAETYNVAVRVDASHSGEKVTSLRLPLTTTEGLSSPSAFATTKLAHTTVDGKRVNDADLATVEASFADGYLTATFAEPITVGSDGIWVGATFTVESLTVENREPLMGRRGGKQGGFSLMSSNTQRKWDDVSETNNFICGMLICIDGDYAEYSLEALNGAGTITGAEITGAVGNPAEYTMTLRNIGGGPITELGYVYRIGEGEPVKAKLPLATPLEPVYGYEYTFTFPVQCPSEVWNGDVYVGVDEVNGKSNSSTVQGLDARMKVVSYLPVHRPLVEEFTGTWCGYCTRGTAAFEHMTKNYPDLFVGAAYHRRSDDILKDPMEVADVQLPVTRVPSFPKCTVERDEMLDPYTGRLADATDDAPQNAGFGFLDYWNARRARFTPADIQAKAAWADEAQTEVRVDADVCFVDAPDYGVRVGYILTADGLMAPQADDLNWLQQNSCMKMDIDIPEIEKFSNGTSKIAGLEYNHVVVWSSGPEAEEGSLPAQIAADTHISHRKHIPAASVKGAYGDELIQHRDRLHVIAYVMDETSGRVINSCVTHVGAYDPNGVDAVNSDARVLRRVWHSLDGRVVTDPVSGIYVETTIYSDGSSRSRKVALGGKSF